MEYCSSAQLRPSSAQAQAIQVRRKLSSRSAQLRFRSISAQGRLKLSVDSVAHAQFTLSSGSASSAHAQLSLSSGSAQVQAQLKVRSTQLRPSSAQAQPAKFRFSSGSAQPSLRLSSHLAQLRFSSGSVQAQLSSAAFHRSCPLRPLFLWVQIPPTLFLVCVCVWDPLQLLFSGFET